VTGANKSLATAGMNDHGVVKARNKV